MPAAAPRLGSRWWALVILSLTELVIVLDATIMTIALPEAQRDLGMPDGQRQWVITAYALAFGALLLLGGRIADYWGRKRTFMVGMLGFGAASVWGGLAQGSGELIAARALQGAFAALLAPAALAMLTVLFPSGRERSIAFAVFGTIAGGDAAVGLVMGGVLTEYASWRWCLLVNVAFVAVGALGGLRLLQESKADGGGRLDIWGAVTVTVVYTSATDRSKRDGNSQLTAFTHGYSTVFLASAIAMLAAAALAAALIRGSKGDLMPQWDADEATAH